MTLDRITARALVEAGYMPLTDYIAAFGPEILALQQHLEGKLPSDGPDKSGIRGRAITHHGLTSPIPGAE